MLLAGCDFFDNDREESDVQISGIAQKGLFTTLEVTAFVVDPASGILGDPIEATVTDQNFSVDVSPNQLIKLEATGTFINEATGLPSTLDLPLTALVDVGAENVQGNINIATTLIAELFLNDLTTSGLSADQLLVDKTAFVNQALGFVAGTDPTALDFNNITAASGLTDPNLHLLLLSGAIAELVQEAPLFTGGLQTLIDNIVAAQTAGEAAGTLGALSGVYVGPLLEKIRDAGVELPDLPNVGSAILICTVQGFCSWEDAPAQSVSVSGTTVWEASGTARVFVRRGTSASTSMEVSLTAAGASATPGEDFIAFGRTVTIAAGQDSRWVDIDIVIDALSEPTEKIALTIESQDSDYPVYAGEAEVAVKNGAPANLGNQNADGISVLSFAIPKVCYVSDYLAEDNCRVFDSQQQLPVADGSTILGSSTIDLAASCPAGSNCPQQLSDWLVNFYLVTDDAPQPREVPLGPYIYRHAGAKVQLVNDPPLGWMPWLRLDSAAVSALAQDANSNNWDLRIEARVGATNTVVNAMPIASIVAVPDSVWVGDTLLSVGLVTSLSPGSEAGCQTAEYAIDGQYHQVPEGPAIAAGILCVDFDATNTSTAAVMAEGRLDVIGGTAEPDSVALALPPGLVARITINGRTGSLPGFMLVSNQPALPVQTSLHAEGWPFTFEISSFALTPMGLELGYNGMSYVMETGYSPEDPRAGKSLYSNDIYYRGVSGQSGTLLLNPDGVDGEINVSGGEAHTAFPKGRVIWNAFSQVIETNRLLPTEIGLNRFFMNQSTSCRGPNCERSQFSLYTVSAAATTLDSRGFVLGDAVNVAAAKAPGFGAHGDGSLAWSRPDDLPAQQQARLAIAGYRLPAEFSAAHFLLAHVDDPENSGDDNQLFPLGTDAAIDGNYFPVGLSLGPELYRNFNGQPVPGDGRSLRNGSLRIDNAVDPAVDLASTPAVKYVVRNAGITGVFNVASGALGPANTPKFYGYNLDLSRFAVRAVDNQLDSYTWIDGRLALQGDAGGADGLDIWFTNLEMDCSARLGNVSLLYEACDGRDNNENGEEDENCSPDLYAWKAPTDIFAAGFKGNSDAQACLVAEQSFGLEHQMHFAALNKPVVFATEWDPQGYLVPGRQTSAALETYRFDKSDEGKGFPVNTDQANDMNLATLGSAQVQGDAYGWLEFKNTQVGVPFWNSINADLRIANQGGLGGPVAEPTAVVPAGELTGLNASQRNRDLIGESFDKGDGDPKKNPYDIRARYEWGNTGFGFQLPVYYQPWQLDSGNSDEDAQGRQSRFLGRQLEWDLFVLDANAGINFIEPDRTKLSFGASADFNRLGSLNIQIDVTDPDSAGAVDDLLIKLKIIRGPLLEPALRDLLDTVNVVNRFASRGLDELMQEGLERAVLEIGKAAAPLTPNNQDPFVTASEGLTQLRSLPQQGMALVTAELRDPLDDYLFSIENALGTQLASLENRLRNLPNNPTQSQLNDAFAQIDQVIAYLDAVIVQVEQVDSAVVGVIGEVEQLRSDVQRLVDAVTQATYDVELVARQAVNVSDTICNDDFRDSAEGNGFLNQAAQRFVQIRKLSNIIQTSTEVFTAAETLATDDAAKRRLSTARQRITDATGELLFFVNAADDAVRDAVCPNQLSAALAKVVEYTNKIRRQARSIGSDFNSATSPVDDLLLLQQELSDSVLRPMRSLRTSIGQARYNAEDTLTGANSGTGATLVQAIDCVLQEVTMEVDCGSQIPDDVIGINTIYADQPGQIDLVVMLFGPVRDRIDGVFNTVETEFAAFTDKLLPGAYFTPEQLRRLVVTEVMRSPPVKELRMAMDKHFGEIGTSINGIVLQLTDQINDVVQTALASVTGPINDALSDATAAVRAIPLESAGINGFATIAGNELERAHLSAGWTMRGSDKDDSTGFKAALDAESWSTRTVPDDANVPTACSVGDPSSLLDVKISAYGLPIKVLAADIDIEKLYLGFTLQSQDGAPALLPIGVFGGISTMGEIGFTEAIVFDPAFAAAVGKLQTYVGASAAASFSDIGAEVAFLVGRVCPGNTVLTDLDPEVVKFLPALPASGFTGAYLRGGATIPIIPGGCALNVGVTADFGSWIFVGSPTNIGGLVGGGAIGQVLCIASIRGKVRVGGNVSTNGDLKLTGDAWGAAGAGLCEPDTWTSVARSRDDGLCGTGDVQFGASFDNGKWKFNPPKPSAIH